jgi:hypothetical protein
MTGNARSAAATAREKDTSLDTPEVQSESTTTSKADTIEKPKTLLSKKSSEKSKRKNMKQQSRNEEKFLLAQFSKSASEFCNEIQNIFSALNIASIDELNALEIAIKCKKKEIKEQAKTKIKTRRNFYQVEVKKGVFVWYVRERIDGKLSQLKHFGNLLPEDIDPELDKVNFHPSYIDMNHSDRIKIPERAENPYYSRFF